VKGRGGGVAPPNRTRWKGGEEGSSVGLLGFVWMGWNLEEFGEDAAAGSHAMEEEGSARSTLRASTLPVWIRLLSTRGWWQLRFKNHNSLLDDARLVTSAF
jgi:hypothetical protein